MYIIISLNTIHLFQYSFFFTIIHNSSSPNVTQHTTAQFRSSNILTYDRKSFACDDAGLVKRARNQASVAPLRLVYPPCIVYPKKHMHDHT